VRGALFAALAALGLAACGSSGNASLSAKCTDRLVARAERLGHAGSLKAEVRRYARVTYCDRFAQKGWIYADGALSIDAQHWLEQGARCSTSTPGGKTVTTPCVDPSENPRTIDCGMLHFVRRSEVQTYIAELQRSVTVICDDHTPLTALGVP
jgi:hypothetical protein